MEKKARNKTSGKKIKKEGNKMDGREDIAKALRDLNDDELRKLADELNDADRERITVLLRRPQVMPIDECAPRIAALYAMGTLDCVVRLAEAVYKDTQENREQYRPIPKDLYRDISRFARLGKNEEWPDKDMRATTYKSLLGPPDYELAGSHKFRNDAGNVRNEAKIFFSNPQVPINDRDRSGFLSACRKFREFLVRLCGTGLSIGVEDITSVFDSSRQVLSHPSWAQVFNAQPITGKNWPLCGPHGSDLVANISALLAPRFGDCDITLAMLRDDFTDLQQIAQYGAETIETVLRDDWQTLPDPLNHLMDQAHLWANALETYQENVRKRRGTRA